MALIPMPEDHTIIVFGANGDLARRKLLPALYHLAAEGLMPERYSIIGNSRSEMTDEGFRDFARDAVDDFCRCSRSEDVWSDFARRLSYVSGEFQPGSTDSVADAIRKTEAELLVDANGAYDAKLALRLADDFAGAGVTWFEEPVSSDDLEGLARIRDRAPTGIEIAAGEYGYDLSYFERMLHAGAVDAPYVVFESALDAA